MEINKCIYKTYDYDIFKILECNRNIIPLHVKGIITSIKKKDLTSSNPISVNENFEIIDGQHRFMACKELGLPIHYLMNKLSNDDMSVLNSVSKSWSISDHIHYFTVNKYPHYINLTNLMKELNISIEATLILCNKFGKKGYSHIRTGEFVLSDEKVMKAKRDYLYIDNIIETIENFCFDPKKVSFTRKIIFMKALKRIVVIPSYDHERMIKNTTLLKEKLSPSSTEEGYTEMMVHIYNYNRSGANRIILEKGKRIMPNQD